MGTKDIIRLSYPLTPSTPTYGNNPIKFSAKGDKSIENGDSCNTSILTLPSHIGTHVDAPYHFSRKGLTIDNFEVQQWFFSSIKIINISNEISSQSLKSNNYLVPFSCDYDNKNNEKDTDLIILYTGFHKYRGENRYWDEYPGLHPDWANALKKNYPRLKAIMVDFISISSWKNREAGRNAHKEYLLDPNHPILLIEDADLSKIPKIKSFEEIVVAPLIFVGGDGAPCTIFAKVSEWYN